MSSISQVHILPRLLRFKEAKRDQVITIENMTNEVINYEFSAAKYKEGNGESVKTITLFQSNQPNGKINAKQKERIIIQYIGSFTKKETEKAEVLQILIDDSPHFNQTITIDCEFESIKQEDLNEDNQKTDDDLKKIVSILNLNDDDPKSKKKKLSIDEILKPLKSPKLKAKKLKNLTVLIIFTFFISLAIFAFSIYTAFLNGYNHTFQRLVDFYGLERIVKLCLLEDNIFKLFTFNNFSTQNFYSPYHKNSF